MKLSEQFQILTIQTRNFPIYTGHYIVKLKILRLFGHHVAKKTNKEGKN